MDRGQRSGRDRGQKSDVRGREKIMGCLDNLCNLRNLRMGLKKNVTFWQFGLYIFD